MKVALPIWNNRISPVMDSAGRLTVVEVEDGLEISRTGLDLEDGPLSKRARRLTEMGLDVLICGAVSRPLAEAITSKGVKIIPWMAGEEDEIINAYLTGRLEEASFRMPGCRGTKEGGRLRRLLSLLS